MQTTRALTYLFRIVLTNTLNRPNNQFVLAFVFRVSPFFQAMFSLDDIPGFQSMSSFQSLDESDFEEPAIQEPRSHTLFYTYTSGTTGLPKGVEISHYAFIAALKLNWYVPGQPRAKLKCEGVPNQRRTSGTSQGRINLDHPKIF